MKTTLWLPVWDVNSQSSSRIKKEYPVHPLSLHRAKIDFFGGPKTPHHPNMAPVPVGNSAVSSINTAAITDLENQVNSISSSISSFLSGLTASLAEISVDLKSLVVNSVPVPTPTPVPNSSPVPTPNTQPKPTPVPTGQIQWPSYTGVATFVGITPSGRVTVYYDKSLGFRALQNATDFLSAADTVVSFNDSVFGNPGSNVNVILFALGDVTDGTGGADHASCDFIDGGNIEVDVSYGNSLRVSALFEAEYSECSMNGQLCGYSTGESLSRWCSMAQSGNALSDFATAPIWFDAGMPNWVDRTEPTDQDPVSTGCGMAFISYLIHQGYTLDVIAQKMVSLGDSGTLSQLYEALGQGSASSAWTVFSGAVRALKEIENDDPFGMVQSAMRHRPIQRV